jgi:hypothetical protein
VKTECLGVCQGQPSERGDEGDHHVGNHRDLQQRDEGVAADLEESCILAKEDANEKAEAKANENLRRDADLALL